MTVFQEQIIYLCNLVLIYLKAHTPDKRSGHSGLDFSEEKIE